MEAKQLVDKFINGEITEMEFDTETSKLSPEEQTALKKEAESKLPDAVEKLKSVRRGIEKISTDKNTTFEAKVQKENLEEARSQFYKDFGLEKEEEKKSFEEGFKTENINVPNIIKDMKAHYVAKNPDKYLALEQEKKAREKEAEDFNGQNAAGGGSGGAGDNNKVSKEVKDYMEASRKAGRTITPEFAQRALSLAGNKGRIK